MGLASSGSDCKTFRINICMMQYILPMARNLRTGQTVKTQDLSGRRLRTDQTRVRLMMADRLAEQMTQRGVDQWEPVVKTFTV